MIGPQRLPIDPWYNLALNPALRSTRPAGRQPSAHTLDSLGFRSEKGSMRILLKLILAICLSVSLIACKTVDGPRHPIPSQDIAGAVPDGLSRVVLFNTSNRLLYFESGPIRIQLDGQQLPSIWLDHYVQAFVEPGTYELKLEHYDMVF
jgi:hypothetical protein